MLHEIVKSKEQKEFWEQHVFRQVNKELRAANSKEKNPAYHYSLLADEDSKVTFDLAVDKLRYVKEHAKAIAEKCR